MSLKQHQASCGPPFPFHLPPCSLEEALTQPDSSSFDPGIPTSVKQNGCSLSITGASHKKSLQHVFIGLLPCLPPGSQRLLSWDPGRTISFLPMVAQMPLLGPVDNWLAYPEHFGWPPSVMLGMNCVSKQVLSHTSYVASLSSVWFSRAPNYWPCSLTDLHVYPILYSNPFPHCQNNHFGEKFSYVFLRVLSAVASCWIGTESPAMV